MNVVSEELGYPMINLFEGWIIISAIEKVEMIKEQDVFVIVLQVETY